MSWIEEEKNLTNEEFVRLNQSRRLPNEYHPYGEFVISYNLMRFIETVRKDSMWWHVERKPLRERLAQ